jgi:glycosyltransferase involved in cell wall biosynthesis
MANTPKVSVLSISYNQEKNIRDELDGFVMQKTDFPFEVIIADDCSTDNTPKIIAEYAEKYPDIFKPNLRKKNVGSVPNLLSVLRAATGTYIAICEGDDYWTDPNKLQTQVDFLDKHPSCGGCFHRAEVIYSTGNEESYIFPNVDDPAWYTTTELLKTNYIPTDSVMYRRVDYTEMPLDVMPYDWYLHLYHAQFGGLRFIDKVMSVYRKHEAGLWWEFDKNRELIWQKYGLSYLALFTGLSKIYNQNDEQRIVIQSAIYDTLNNIIKADEKFSEVQLSQALTAYSELTVPFITFIHDKLEETDTTLRRVEKDLLAVGDERHELLIKLEVEKQVIVDLQADLHEITTSRVWRAKLKADKLKQKLVRAKSQRN